jgi:hypothetical protein
MSLPNHHQAHVDQRKLTEYLLNRDHPDAKGKSAFFCGQYGDDWERLRDDLLKHATGAVVSVEETRHGTMSVVKEGGRARAKRLDDPDRRVVPTARDSISN